MKPNREQVVKALECCSKQYKDNTSDKCPDCMYHGLGCNCVLQAITDALTLIKELTEENERLRTDCVKGANALIEEMQRNRTIRAATVRELAQNSKALLNSVKESLHAKEDKAACSVSIYDIDEVLEEAMKSV